MKLILIGFQLTIPGPGRKIQPCSLPMPHSQKPPQIWTRERTSEKAEVQCFMAMKAFLHLIYFHFF